MTATAFMESTCFPSYTGTVLARGPGLPAAEHRAEIKSLRQAPKGFILRVHYPVTVG